MTNQKKPTQKVNTPFTAEYYANYQPEYKRLGIKINKEDFFPISNQEMEEEVHISSMDSQYSLSDDVPTDQVIDNNDFVEVSSGFRIPPPAAPQPVQSVKDIYSNPKKFTKEFYLFFEGKIIYAGTKDEVEMFLTDFLEKYEDVNLDNLFLLKNVKFRLGLAIEGE